MSFIIAVLTFLFLLFYQFEVLQFTLRLDEALLNKLGYIAEYEGRTKNKEIQHLIQQHIVHFEQEHGAIDLREIQQEEPVS